MRIIVHNILKIYGESADMSVAMHRKAVAAWAESVQLMEVMETFYLVSISITMW